VDVSTLRGNPNQLLSTEVYGLFNTNDTSYSLNNFGAIVDSTNLQSVTGSYNYYEGTSRLRNHEQFVYGDMIGNTSSFGALEVTLTREYKENLSGEVQSNQIGYGPKCDLFSLPPNSIFENIREGSTYFTSPYGLYYVDNFVPIAITSSYMLENSGPNDKGIWNSTTTYSRGDVVTNPYNNKLYSYVSPRNATTSSPEVDGRWSIIYYRKRNQQKLVRAFLVTGSYTSPGKTKYLNLQPGDVNYGTDPSYASGSTVEYFKVSITDDLSNSYGTLPTEYQNTFPRHIHFIQCRDKTLGGLRRTYLGTLNTKATSADGGFPYEIFDIEGNELTVGSPEPCADCD
jgi:hypothetical protein